MNTVTINQPIVQLELFKASKRLNLSETYEAIPKEVSVTDPSIDWVNENIANPIEKSFQVAGQTYISEIAPAPIKDKKTNVYKSCFPDLREARIEYAIISLATKQAIDIDQDKENNKIFVLKTTYYQIQKEIVEAINKREGKNLKPHDCPYNVTGIKQALEVLKMTSIKVKNADGEGQYIFNRIKDVYLDQKTVCIELGNMITNYISSGDWRATDKDSILASKGKYELKLRVLFNLKFRYAEKASSFNPSLDYLIHYMDFIESPEKRTTLQRIEKILNKMPEVERIITHKIFEKRKLIGANFELYPAKEFISTMIDNNKRMKRLKTNLLDEEGKPLIEPIRSDFPSNSEYIKAKKEFDIEKGRALFDRK